MGLYMDKIDFDGTDAASIAESSQIGAHLLGDSDVEITSTTVGGDEALDVNIVQATGMAIFNEDDASASGAAGQSILGVRQDALASSTSLDGDYAHFKQNAKGEQYVIDTDGNALLTTIDADTGSILTDTNAMVVDLAAIEILLGTIDADTSSIATDASTIAGDTTSMDGILTALSKAEDAVHGSGDKGIMALAVANHVEGALHSADGDYAALQVDSSGRLRVIGDLDVVGNVADDAADSGNPLKIGSRASFGAAMSAISASNDRADMLSDEYRRLWVNDSPNVGITLSKPTISSVQAEIAGTAQASRRRILVQNLSSKEIYVGPTGVLTTTGLRIAKGALLELPWGEDLDIFAISAAGISSDVRVLEVA